MNTALHLDAESIRLQLGHLNRSSILYQTILPPQTGQPALNTESDSRETFTFRCAQRHVTDASPYTGYFVVHGRSDR
jgi:hypothetical protein